MPQILLSTHKGKIFSESGLLATGMKGKNLFVLKPKDLIKLPPGSRLFMMPSRRAIGYDPLSNNFKISKDHFAASAFLAPGYTATYTCAYEEIGRPKYLPLFSYAAAVLYKGEIYAAAIHVDKDIRHDTRFIDLKKVRSNYDKILKLFPENRLIPHLKRCALLYGCPNAQNFFLSRFEAPLPTSPSCNASCRGCISYQTGKVCYESQPRIKFIPTPEEISEVALYHIANTKNAIVSFGQGCEGEPLLQSKIIEESIRLIRASTRKGQIHMNTNGSKSHDLNKLFIAGLNSVRISMNSARGKYYNNYYKPRNYKFNDVLRSISIAKKNGAFISINYLTMPGFTDRAGEFKAIRNIIKRYKVDMIQWRNLNFDPLKYFDLIDTKKNMDKLIGIKEEIGLLKKEFPRLRMGYFNPYVANINKYFYQN